MLAHRSHDFGNLMDRWRAVAADCDLRIVALTEEGGFPVIAIEGREPARGAGLYLSAGIHGDEPAAVAGLISWAERRREFLRDYPVVIFPCLNPWGIENNSRLDHAGRDMNRMFGDGIAAPIRQWKAYLGNRQFRMALSLHEDYDARGIYVYELGQGEGKLGDGLLRACENIIPRQPGSEVEGREAKAGVITPEGNIEDILEEIEGMPEAIALFLNHAPFSLTFETPSEYSLFQRAKVHERFLDGVVEALMD